MTTPKSVLDGIPLPPAPWPGCYVFTILLVVLALLGGCGSAALKLGEYLASLVGLVDP